MNVEQLVQLFAWMSVINLCLFLVGLLKITLFRNLIQSLQRALFSHHLDSLMEAAPRVLMNYYILILMFNVVLFGDAYEAPAQDRDRQEGHHAQSSPQDEGQAQKHGLPRGDIHGYPRSQRKHSRCQLWLGLCAGAHAGTYGKGVGGLSIFWI